MPTAKASSSPTKMGQVHGIPLALLSSAYSLVKEAGVPVARLDRWAVLVFHPSGAAFLLLGSGKPEEDKAYEGTFSYSRGVLTLRFTSPALARSVSVPVDLAAGQFTMPFQVFSAGTGDTVWERSARYNRLLDNAASLCNALVLARKTDAQSTTVFLAEYLRPFVHRAGTPEIDVSPAPPIHSMTSFNLRPGALSYEMEDQPGGSLILNVCFRELGSGIDSSSGGCPNWSWECTPKACACRSSSNLDEAPITPGEATVTGPCERARIDEVVSQHFSDVHICVANSGASSELERGGSVSVSFNIDAKGAVGAVKLAKSTLSADSLEPCLLTRVLRWRFPPPKRDGACGVNYTFVFKAAASHDGHGR